MSGHRRTIPAMDLRPWSYPRRFPAPRHLAALVVALALAATVVLAVASWLPDPPVSPQQTALAVCSLDGHPPGPRWSGSADTEQAQLWCTPEDPSMSAVAARLHDMGYLAVETRTPVTDHLGNTRAWAVFAHDGPARDISVAGAPGRAQIDVVVGGTIHVHSDGTPHHHGPDDPPGP